MYTRFCAHHYAHLFQSSSLLLTGTLGSFLGPAASRLQGHLRSHRSGHRRASSWPRSQDEEIRRDETSHTWMEHVPKQIQNMKHKRIKSHQGTSNPCSSPPPVKLDRPPPAVCMGQASERPVGQRRGEIASAGVASVVSGRTVSGSR